MTSTLEQAGKVRRITPGLIRDRGRLRAIVIELGTHTVRVRTQHARNGYELSYEELMAFAIRREVERVRREKQAARKEARKGARRGR